MMAKGLMTFPEAHQWVVDSPRFHRTFIKAKSRDHNATMLLKGIVSQATEEALIQVAGDKKKIRRVQSSLAVVQQAVASKQWVETFDPGLVDLEGPVQRVPARQWLEEQRQMVEAVTIPEKKKQREWSSYLGKPFVRRFAEEAVDIALNRFDQHTYCTGKDCWDLLMESLRDTLELALVRLIRRGTVSPPAGVPRGIPKKRDAGPLKRGTLEMEEERVAELQCMKLAIKAIPQTPEDWYIITQHALHVPFRTIAQALTAEGHTTLSEEAARLRAHRVGRRLIAKYSQLLEEAYERNE